MNGKIKEEIIKKKALVHYISTGQVKDWKKIKMITDVIAELARKIKKEHLLETIDDFKDMYWNDLSEKEKEEIEKEYKGVTEMVEDNWFYSSTQNNYLDLLREKGLYKELINEDLV